MQNIILYILTILGFVVFSLFLLVVAILIKDRFILKKLKEKLDILNNLFNKLTQISNKENIPIHIENKEEMKTAAGMFQSYRDTKTGCFCPEMPMKILLLDKYKDDPWILAHELGHYYGLKNSNDSSEQRANLEGKKLALSLLNSYEMKILKDDMRIYLS